MSVVYCNSFGQYTQGWGVAAGMLGEDFTYFNGNPGIISIETGRGYWAYGGGTYSNNGSLYLPSYLTTMIVGAQFWGEYLYQATPVWRFFDDSSQMLSLSIDNAGRFYFTRAGTELLKATKPLLRGGWDHFTFKIVFHNTAGAIYIYRNGILDASATGIDTINTGTSCNRIVFDGPTHSGGGPVRISDLWVDDADVLSPRKCVYEPCDTAGSSSVFTPTGDTNVEDCVDEYQPDGDTTYNVSGTPSDKDQIAHSEATSLPGGVDAVQVIARARKEDSNDGQLKLGVLQASAEDQGSAKTLTTSYLWSHSIFLLDPSTSAAWDPDDVGDAESSYENVSVP